MTATELSITEQDTPAGVIVVLAGEADVLNSGRLVEALMQRLPMGVTKLVVDVARLAYIDSMALRALVMAARVLKQRGGRLTLLQPSSTVQKMLMITGADQYMTVQAAAGPGASPA